MMSFLLVLGLLAPGAHPHLYSTPEDVARARLNVQRFEWARGYADSVCRSADEWAEKSDDELRALVPPPGSTFAYGFSGCPECGADWPWWGGGGVASFDRPGTAQCPSCKRLFPDADHPDSGTGWRNPADGKTYYFLGCYNAFAANQITLRALGSLSMAYTLTGDRKYSRAAAALFDSLADTYPTSVVGSVDYPSKNNYGRLERPQYQVARVLVLLADDLDLLYDSPDFAAPSASGKGSVREHVEEAIIRDGGRFCYGEAVKGYMGLTNGQADYVRGALAAGIMLGEKPLIDCATEGPYSIFNFLANCLDRDGQYYETSVGYASHALSLYVDIAEMLYNLRTPEHPEGIDLYDHPKLRKALFQASIDLDCFRHYPRFGDWQPDVSVEDSDERYSPLLYRYSEVLAARARDEESRRRWEAAREFVCDGDVEAKRKLNAGKWRLVFQTEPVRKAKAAEGEFEPHAVLGGKGIVILRTGKRAAGCAALLRYGPSHNHGHFDDLNLNFYGLGRELTYDLGYVLGSAHVQTGWSKQTASHNLVVVNEKSQMAAPGGGGSAHLYVDAAPVRAFEASSEASYASEGVETYRRTLALVDLPGGGKYLVDVFRVAGGHQHDLMWHFAGEMAGVGGAEMGEVQEEGSLAGPELDWGRKVGASGDLIGCADRGPYWVAPPGNGYGFLYDVRRSVSVPPECAVKWTIDGKTRDSVTLRLLAEPGSQLITARAPGVLLDFPKADYAILRRTGEDLRGAFVSVVEPARGECSVRSSRRLECDADAGLGAVGVEVKTADGTDYVLSAMRPGPAVFRTSSGRQIRFNGQFGFLRTRDGRVERGVLAGGMELSFGAFKLTSPAGAYTGTITGVNQERSQITLSQELPQGLEGRLAFVNGPGYSHNSPYRIKEVAPDRKTLTLDGDLVIARGHIGNAQPTGPDALANEVPIPRSIVVMQKQSGYFRGKLITNDCTGKSSTVIDVEADRRTVRVRDPKRFRAGDDFTIYDIRPGDEVRVLVVMER